MTRFLTGLTLFLFYCSAQAELAAAANAPENEATASPLGVIIFGVIFVGFCVGFMWMIYANDKKKKQGDTQSHDASGKTT